MTQKHRAAIDAMNAAESQVEWLKARLAWLQLPPNKQDHDTREKWLLECGMPPAIEDAKAAAQGDYNGRILSALRSPPEPGQDAPEPVSVEGETQ
jgi:hypothetical protein